MKALPRRTRWFLALVIVCLLVALLTCAFGARAKSIFSVALALLLLLDLLEPIGWLVHAIVRGPSIGEEPTGSLRPTTEDSNMTASKMTPETLAESIMNAQLARQHEFGSAVAGINSEFIKHNSYGGSAWYAERNRVGKDELRRRAEIIRVAWQQVLYSQSARSAKKLRPVAAKYAKDRFSTEAREVVEMAVPKAGTLYPAGDPTVLDVAAKQISDELFAGLLLSPTPPEKSWLVRQFQDQTSTVFKLIVTALIGALIARGGDVWHWIRSLVWPN